MTRIMKVTVGGDIILRDATPAEVAEIEAVRNAPPPVPSAISRRQFLIALMQAGLITDAEALAAARTGEVPIAIDAMFARFPPEQALDARITWATMTVVERRHSLLDAMVQLGLVTDAGFDALFRQAAEL
jgi:hypothetical protein